LAKKSTNKVPVDKLFFDLSGGLHTESSPLAFPPEVTLDEQNFEILTDGTRRRRRGLTYEKDIISSNLFEKYDKVSGTQTYTWRNVGSVSTKTFIVLQLGSYLYFFEEGDTIGDKFHPQHINLGFYVTGENTKLIEASVSLTHGRGRLYVANPEIEPLSIEYLAATDEFVVRAIPIKTRTFDDINDGIGIREFVNSESNEDAVYGGATVVNDCPNSHEFNLRNRGWLFGDDEEGAFNYVRLYKYWPDKQKIPYAGYYASPEVLASDGLSTVTSDQISTGGTSGWYNLGHVKKWSSDKIQKEVFGNAYVPRGSFISLIWDNEFPEGAGANHYNRNGPITAGGGDLPGPISADVNLAQDAIRYIITMTAPLPADTLPTVDNLTGDPTIVSTAQFALEHVFSQGAFPNSGSDANTPTIWYSRTFKVVYANLSTGNQEFEGRTYPPNSIGFDAQVQLNGRNMSRYFLGFREVGRTNGEAVWQFENAGGFKLAKLGDGTATADSPGLISTEARPSSNAWFAGRLFHAGMNTEEWADTVFFSKTVLNKDEFGQCFQAADPTHPEINTLDPTDGGTIQIPNVGNIVDMLALEGALIVFSDRGVWEISGAKFFAADDIRVRQITSAEAISPSGITAVDNGLIYTSHRGIYIISRSADASGSLQAQNLIENSIQTYWNGLSYQQQKYASLSFDESKSRLFIAHNDNVDNRKINTVLVFDLRLGSFFKYRFAPAEDLAYIVQIHSTDQASQPDEFKKMKYFIINGTGLHVQVADFSQDTFTDFDGIEHIPYLITGYDNLQDFSRQRYSPTIHTFMKKTETGYTLDGPVNESSLTVQPRWDFTNSATANKFGREQQVYRHKRAYVPSGSTDLYDDGYDLVVARTKIRGRGKALQLKFTGAAGKDAHLLGWALHYEGTAEV
jgi:hypothetical protein